MKKSNLMLLAAGLFFLVGIILLILDYLVGLVVALVIPLIFVVFAIKVEGISKEEIATEILRHAGYKKLIKERESRIAQLKQQLKPLFSKALPKEKPKISRIWWFTLKESEKSKQEFFDYMTRLPIVYRVWKTGTEGRAIFILTDSEKEEKNILNKIVSTWQDRKIQPHPVSMAISHPNKVDEWWRKYIEGLIRP